MKKHLFLFLIACLFIITASAQEIQSFKFKSSGTKFKLGKEMSSTGEIKISPSVNGADNPGTTIIQKNLEYEIVANQEYTVSGVIKVLDVIGNSLTSLDVSKLTNLERLDCYRNQLTSLDVSNLTNLVHLDFGNNQLTSIGVSNLKNLKKLFCSSNQLTGLALSNLTNLERLVCYNNQLTSLDIPNLTNLERLDCSKNQLTSLNVSGLSNLERLVCYENQFTGLDVSNLKKLKRLVCYKNQLTSLDVSNLTNLRHLDFGNNQLTSIDVSNLTNLEGLFCPNNQLTGLDLSSLKKMKRLVCYRNQLTSLDVSSLTNLERLVCYINPLTSLDVSNLTKLSYLDLGDNQLTSLDVSNLTSLDTLLCPNNQLTSLDVSGLKNLKKLNCRSNQLIDIKNQNISLVSDFSGDNQIRLVIMKINEDGGYISENSYAITDGHTLGLPNGISLENGYFKCTKLPNVDVAFNTGIAWGDKKIEGILKLKEQSFKFKSSGTKFELGDLTSYPGEIKIFPSVKNSDNAETTIIQKNVEYEIVADWEYTVSGVITDLDVVLNSLTSLDVSNLINLKSLYCYRNQLTSLDVTNLTNLEELNCTFNQLTSLDVSNLTNLKSLYCHNNELASLDISGLPNLNKLECGFNRLIDIKNKNTALVQSLLGGNQIRVISMKIDENGGYISENSFAISDGHNINILNEMSFENGYFKCTELPSEDVTFSTDIGFGNKKISGRLKFEVPFFKFKSSETKFKLGDLTSYTGGIKISPSVKNSDDSEINIIQKNVEYEIVADREYTVTGVFTHLDVDENSLTSLDVSNLTSLKTLNCFNNQLTSLDVSGLKNLNTLNCSSNQLIDIKNEDISLVSDFSGDKQIRLVGMKIDENGGYISENSFDITDGHNINLPDGISFANGYFKCTELPSEDVAFSTDIGFGNKKISGRLKFELPFFKFKSSGTKFKLGKKMSYTGEIEISPSVKGADNSETNIIQKNVAYKIVENQEYTVSGVIKSLNVEHNSLTSLDVSNLINLEVLTCPFNQLTSLDVSNLTNLKRLECRGNQLTSLDVSNLTNLERLVCAENQLTSLDISGLKNLDTLGCVYNRLIDIKNKNTSLVSEFYGRYQFVVVIMKINEDGGYISENSYAITDGRLMDMQSGISLENGYFKCAELPSKNVAFVTGLNWGKRKIEGKLEFKEQSFEFKSSGTNLILGDATSYTGEIKIFPSVKNSENSEINIIQKNVEYEIVADQKYTVTGVFTHLDVKGNSLTSLDVYSLINLEELSCSNNQLTSLDVSNLKKLKSIACSENQLTSLDVSNLKKLKSIACSENQLTNLDVSNLTNLKRLECRDNQLTSLDVSNLTNLERLVCAENQLTSLDISGLKNLDTLDCDRNRLIDIKNENTSLVSLFYGRHQYVVVIMKINEDGGYISENSYAITDKHIMDMQSGISLENGYFKCSKLPSESVGFNTYLGLYWGERKIEGELEFEEYADQQSFKFESSGAEFKLGDATSYTGDIKISPSVKGADNYETNIIQKNVEYKIVANQEYTVLGLITDLDVVGNSLTSLDISNLINLERLDCSNNKLTGLDVSGLPNLNTLNCSSNRLIDIENDNISLISDFSGDKQMKVVSMKIDENGGYISENSFDITDGHNINLPDGITLENGYFKCTELPSEDVTFNTDIAWGDKKIKGKLKFAQQFFKFKSSGTEFSLDCTNAGEIKIFPSVKGPDDSKTNIIQKNVEYKIVANQEYTVSGLITVLRLPYISLTSLDVSNLTILEELYCVVNKLTNLDVSNLTNLERLDCYNNQLTSLNVSNLTNFEALNCSNNQLTSLELSNLKNLKKLYCSSNQLTGLGLSSLTNLKKLVCYRNQLTSLNVSNLTNLEELSCSDNQLTSLDVSELTNLEFIGCSSNQLIDINNANTNSISSFVGDSQNLWIPMKADASGGFISVNTYNTVIGGHKIELPEGFSFEAGRFKCLQIPNEEILFSTDIGLEHQKIEGKLKFERVIESSISGVKKLEGKDLIANQFEFVLLNDSEKIVGTAKNLENGEFTISVVSPREAVTYNYILKEKNDGQQGYTYDTKEYSVELVVALNTENVLAASITIKDGETIVETPVFTNTYIDTGINEFNADSQIKLYPNPVNDILQIESLETIKEITLSDISGKILITQQVNGTYFSLPTAQLNAGIYIIRLQTAKGLEYRKIIKE